MNQITSREIWDKVMQEPIFSDSYDPKIDLNPSISGSNGHDVFRETLYSELDRIAEEYCVDRDALLQIFTSNQLKRLRTDNVADPSAVVAGRMIYWIYGEHRGAKPTRQVMRPMLEEGIRELETIEHPAPRRFADKLSRLVRYFDILDSGPSDESARVGIRGATGTEHDYWF